MSVEHIGVNLHSYFRIESLKDGRPLIIRALRPDDKNALAEGFSHLSQRSIYNRFFTPKKELTESELAYLTELDFVSHVAIGALVKPGEAEIPVGVGRYVVDPSDSAEAEIAFAVEDAYQGLGAATLLLKHLGEIARQAGIKRFRAVVLSDNLPMMNVLRHGPYAQQIRTAGDVTTVILYLDESG
jgi:GNAT superfamily N-acetyltransferase